MSTYKKGASKQLTKNFKLSEFQCKGVGCCFAVLVDTAFIKQLQGFRDYLNVRLGKNASVDINSGYRCPTHNAKIGGSSTSKHRLGKAADIKVKVAGAYLSAKKICAYAQDYGFDGVAYINSTSTHVDNRGVRWWADETKNNKTVADFYKYFGISRESNPYTPPTVAIKKGSEGDSVKWVQWYLYCLKYYTDKIDGKCGNKTANAIKAFQKANGLTVDGSCGAITRFKLYKVWSDG